jgi:transcriptional regulator with XRE-family HTH domain
MPINTLHKNQRLAFARTLTKLRVAKDLKREYLGNELGLSCASIDKLEQGVTTPRFADVVILCKTLEIDFGEFVRLYEKELLKLSPPPPPRGRKKRLVARF